MQAILRLERGSEGAPHWSAAIWSELLTGGGAVERVALVAVLSDAVVGFVVVGLVAGVAELESVVVDEAERGKGIGKALCRSAMAWARERGAATMELEVRVSNSGAIAVYAALGFLEQGRRTKYYREPEEDAVLMAAALQG